MKVILRYKGGPGSGNKGHKGRPGFVGGSGEGSGVSIEDNPVAPPNDSLDNGLGYVVENGLEYLDTLTGRNNVAVMMPDGKMIQGIDGVFRHTQIYARLILSNQEDYDNNTINRAIKVVDEDMEEYSIVETAVMKKIGAVSVEVDFTGGLTVVGTDGRLHASQQSFNKVFHLIKNAIVRGKIDLPKAKTIFITLNSQHTSFPYDDIDSIAGFTMDDAGRPVAHYKETVEKQLPIDEDSMRTLLNIRQGIFNNEIDSLAERMFSGKISLGAWEEQMKSIIRQFHSSMAAITKGGWNQMSWSDWGRLGTPLREQYKYLHGFAQSIDENRDTMSLEAIKARAKMYGNAAGYTSNLVNAGQDIINQLPWIPRDGQSSCLVNCRCYWSFKVIDTVGDVKLVQATWKLSPAEHCDTCIERNNFVVMLKLQKDVDVPSYIGYKEIYKESDTAIVAFNFDGNDKLTQLAKQFGESAIKDFHLTLLWLGDVKNLDKSDVITKLNKLSSIYAPITGKINGSAVFADSGDGIPVVVLLDSINLPGLRQAIRDAFPDVEQTHGFTPHITLVYIKNATNAPSQFIKDPIDITCNSIWLFCGDEKIEFPLTGNIITKQGNLRYKGGPGSGNKGHLGGIGGKGNPGGSQPKGSGTTDNPAPPPSSWTPDPDAWYIDNSRVETTVEATQAWANDIMSRGWNPDDVIDKYKGLAYPQSYSLDYDPEWGLTAGTYTAYRVGETENDPTGIYFGPQADEIHGYAYDKLDKTVHEYQVTIKNPLIVENKDAVVSKFFPSKRDPDYERAERNYHLLPGQRPRPYAAWIRSLIDGDRFGHNGTLANRWLDSQLAHKIAKAGYDSLVLTLPELPASREIMLLENLDNNIVFIKELKQIN